MPFRFSTVDRTLTALDLQRPVTISEGLSPTLTMLLNDLLLLRRDDMLLLALGFTNFWRDTIDGVAHARVLDSTKPALLKVLFPPQHITETTVPDPGPLGKVKERVRAGSRLGGESWIVVRAPADAALPLTTEGVLTALGAWPLVVPFDIPKALQPVVPAALSLAQHLGSLAGVAMPPVPTPLTLDGSSVVGNRVFGQLLGRGAGSPGSLPASTVRSLPSASAALPNNVFFGVLATVGEMLQPNRGRLVDLDRLPRSTAVELQGVLFAPTDGRFAHRTAPHVAGPRTALWQTRLLRDSGAPPELRALDVAKWADEPLTAGALTVWEAGTKETTPTTHAQRKALVAHGQSALKAPLVARRLELTAMGAFADLHRAWPGVSGLVGYGQRTLLGRDTRVEVAEAVVLMPFGHRATLTSLSEREAVSDPNGAVAPLVKRSFLTVMEGQVAWTEAQLPNAGRGFPFASVTIPTGRFQVGNATIPNEPALVTTALKGVMRFACIIRDRAGAIARFDLPMLVLDAAVADGAAPAELGTFLQVYNKLSEAVRHGSPLGTPLQLGVGPGGRPLAPPVHELRFQVQPRPKGDTSVPLFRPAVESLRVEVPGAADLAGRSEPREAYFTEGWLTEGNDGNPNGLVLGLKEPMGLFYPGAPTGTAGTGAIAAPHMTVLGLSHDTGIVTGPAGAAAAAAQTIETLQTKKLTAAQFLPDFKLLGVLPVGALIDGASGVVPGLMPLTMRREADGVALTLLKEVGSWGDVSTIAFEPSADTKLELDILTGADARVNATLGAFTLTLFDVISLQVQRIAFRAPAGQKPDLELDFATPALRFRKDLAFIQAIAALIPASAFSDPPDLDIGPAGVIASYSLTLPPIQLGAFALSNLGFGARLELPFTGASPSLRFNLAERHAPFSALVAMIGGGGFFALEFDTGGIRSIEFSLEAQAAIAINLGVAAGCVMLRVGIYFRKDGDGILLEAFAELRGEMRVIGMISVSITFHVALGVQKNGNRQDLVGTATVTVEIDLLFFSKSVEVRCEKRFPGSNADPTFLDAYPADKADGGSIGWAAYVDAFA